MRTMRGIVFTGERRCEVREFPVPEPGQGEVLIRVRASGICGSDLHVFRGASVPGQIGGHEPCGEVERLGPGCRRLHEGERVTVHHHQGCGVCPECARGEEVCCRQKLLSGVSTGGSFAEYCLARERSCVPLPETVSFTDGAFMACVAGTAWGAYRRLGIWPWDSVAVFGLGPVGLSCVLLGKALRLRVVGMDIFPERMAAATACGVDAVIDGNRQDAVAAIREFGRGAQGGHWGEGVDYLIETSGATAAREKMIPSVRREGRIAILGVGGSEKVINPSEIHGRACTIIGSVVYHLDWMWDLARFLAISRTSFEPAVTHRFALDQAAAALSLADSGRCGKVIFLPYG